MQVEKCISGNLVPTRMQRREVKHVAVSQITSFSTEFKRIRSFKELLVKQTPLKKKSDNRFYNFFDNY